MNSDTSMVGNFFRN